MLSVIWPGLPTAMFQLFSGPQLLIMQMNRLCKLLPYGHILEELFLLNCCCTWILSRCWPVLSRFFFICHVHVCCSNLLTSYSYTDTKKFKPIKSKSNMLVRGSKGHTLKPNIQRSGLFLKINRTVHSRPVEYLELFTLMKQSLVSIDWCHYTRDVQNKLTSDMKEFCCVDNALPIR